MSEKMHRGDTVTIAQPLPKPQVGELLQKMCAWAVVNVLNMHPARTGMPPTVVYKFANEEGYRAEASSGYYESLDDIFASTRTALIEQRDNEKQGEVEGYVLLIDLAEDLPELPNMRPPDDGGDPYLPAQPVVFMYMGEAHKDEGFLVIQPYRKRMLRAGAVTVGAPLILPDPPSLLADASPALAPSV